MSFSFAESLVVPIVLGVLCCNVACLLWLLGIRPTARTSSRALGKPLFGPSLRACLAEMIGTFAIVFAGILAISSSAIAGTSTEPPSLLVVALAYGLPLAVMNAAFVAASGGHFNPAVTLGVVAVGRLHPLLGVGYWLAQMVGAAGAAYLLALLFGLGVVQTGTPAPGGEVPLHVAVVLESLATFFLVLVYFGTAIDSRGPKLIAPLLIGLTGVLGVVTIGPLTGAALNPVRYFGPALVLQQASAWVVYLAGPCLGGSIAAVLMQFFFFDEEDGASGEEIAFLDVPPRRTRRSA